MNFEEQGYRINEATPSGIVFSRSVLVKSVALIVNI